MAQRIPFFELFEGFACLGVLGSIVAARVAQRLFFKKGGES